MKAMKTAALFTGMMTLASTAFASGGATHSGLLVWSFLGFCGLIVAFQMVPALMVLVGMFKGITSREAIVRNSAS